MDKRSCKTSKKIWVTALLAVALTTLTSCTTDDVGEVAEGFSIVNGSGILGAVGTVAKGLSGGADGTSVKTDGADIIVIVPSSVLDSEAIKEAKDFYLKERARRNRR